MDFVSNLFSGRPSALPIFSSKKGKRKNEDGNSCRGFNSSGSSSRGAGSAAGRRTGKRDEGVHGIMTSALWAIARTPALVEAVGRVEAAGFEVLPRLSSILAQLRRTGDHRQAAEAADAFLRASRLSFYDSMEPMDAIRGILGLCGDSEQVLEEAVSTTYRYTRVLPQIAVAD